MVAAVLDMRLAVVADDLNPDGGVSIRVLWIVLIGGLFHGVKRLLMLFKVASILLETGWKAIQSEASRALLQIDTFILQLEAEILPLLWAKRAFDLVY